MNDNDVILGSLNFLMDEDSELVLHVREHDRGDDSFIVGNDLYEVYINYDLDFYRVELRFLHKDIRVSDALRVLQEIDDITQTYFLGSDTGVNYVSIDTIKAQPDFLAVVGSLYELKS